MTICYMIISPGKVSTKELSGSDWSMGSGGLSCLLINPLGPLRAILSPGWDLDYVRVKKKNS